MQADPPQKVIPEETVTPDAVAGHWSLRLLPRPARPYGRLMRLERPIGWWLLLLPCWWSALLAAGADTPPLTLAATLILFLIGAVAMRGAGCVYNDIVDRDIDAKVARTRLRPIPAGEVSVRGALVFMLVLALVGLGVLVQFNGFAILTGLASLGVIAAYPFMKRITHWPQAVLGLAFSWGALMGFAVLRADLPPAAFALYAGTILWVIAYDTIYAHQDREDDAIVGVKSTALLFGACTRPILAGFYGAALILFAGAFVLEEVGTAAWIGLCFAAGQLYWQVTTLDIDDGENCLRRFKSNRGFGLILCAGLLADWIGAYALP